MGRRKPNKPRRERPAEGYATDVTPETAPAAPTQILFDSSDPRIETFRKVHKILNEGGEPDPADLQLLWEWHQEDQ